jgi:hypothetical protein
LAKREQIGVSFMPYTITGDTVGLAIGPMSETANDVHDALNKARQMYEEGLPYMMRQDRQSIRFRLGDADVCFAPQNIG